MSGSLSARQSRTNQPPGSDAVAVPLALARPTTEWHQHIQNRRSDPHIAAQISRGPTGMGRPRCRVGAGGVLFVSGHARSPGCFCGGVWVWVVSVSGMRKPLGACAPRGFLYVWCGGVLLSHTLSGAVPSPCQALASGFGMGPGVSPGPWPPQIFSCTVRRWGLPACGGLGTGQRTRICRCFVLWPDNAHCRLVPFAGGRCGPTARGWNVGVAFRPLVPVGSTPRGASTSGLSTTCSAWGLQQLEAARNAYLGAGFPLRCFQRLSLPNVANRPCHWRDNRHTRGSSTQVLSYYGQASSGFQRAQRIETKLSHDVLNPARVPL